jgi:hypothetical protein
MVAENLNRRGLLIGTPPTDAFEKVTRKGDDIFATRFIMLYFHSDFAALKKVGIYSE